MFKDHILGTATSKLERTVISFIGFQPLTNGPKNSMLDVTWVLA